MTVIVALKDEENRRVWIGGDRNRSNGSRCYSGLNPKVWITQDKFGNNWAWGQSGTLQLQQVVQYKVPLPEKNLAEAEDPCGFICSEWMPRLYTCLKEVGGIIRPDPKGGDTMEGAILLGVLGRIFLIGGLAITDISNPFYTIGLGTEPAFGALDPISRHQINLSPEEKIRSAILSASSFY